MSELETHWKAEFDVHRDHILDTSSLIPMDELPTF